MHLIVGLGNPGLQYTWTRHNLGFLVADRLAEQYKASWRPSALIKGVMTKVSLETVECSLLKPTTFMNNSGVAVKQLADKKSIALENILVVCDDYTLPFGQMRLRPSGSAGGHNGLKSIIEHLGSNEFARLRLGVGSPSPSMDAADYVLGNFTSGERKFLPDFLNRSLLCAASWAVQGIDQAMNQFNGSTGSP